MGEETTNYQDNFREDIENLYRLHCVTQQKHIIEYKPDAWKLFEPSKFVYAYFAFNCFYNYDWTESLIKRELLPQNNDEKDTAKFKAMVDFIFSTPLDDSDKELFLKTIKGKYRNREEDIIKVIQGITPDNQIKENIREDFKKEFEKLVKTGEIKQGKIKQEIIPFIYGVRNNIFHGTKTTINMSDSGQRERLEIYSNLIIAINELLFKVLKKKTGFWFPNKYILELDEKPNV
jgi:hypothetical protein